MTKDEFLKQVQMYSKRDGAYARSNSALDNAKAAGMEKYDAEGAALIRKVADNLGEYADLTERVAAHFKARLEKK